jgi:preprotein translocase subunit SecA
MAHEPKVETSSIWERIGDTLSAIGEGIVNFLGRLFGSSNERIVRKIGYLRPRGDGEHAIVAGSTLAEVNRLEPLMLSFSDEALKGLTPQFRACLAGEFAPAQYRKRLLETEEEEGAEAEEGQETDSAEPDHVLEPVPTGETAAQPAEGEEIVSDPLGLASLPSPATLDDLLPYAFAACREAARRSKNMRHYDVQIVGGVVLHEGNIAEMVTGEGKTLVATLPAYLNALEDKGVHIITVNDYLARRDCEWMLPIYRALGMEAGFIQSDMEPVERRRAYDCNITYGTNSEFGFDYLRDNMKPARWGDSNYEPFYQQCQKALHFAIIDEVDNILIDEARTPLIISGPAFGDLRRYAKANDIAVKLTEIEKKARGERGLPPLPSFAANPAELLKRVESEEEGGGLLAGKKEAVQGVYFEVKEKEHTCHLTDQGIRMAEELAGVESFYTAGNMEWPHLIDNALKAHHLYQKDRRYVVMRHPETHEMSIIIVDEFTGRLMMGRQWSDGLHQAVEAKHAREGVKIKEETQTLATVTLQNFFKLYDKLAGMTGTAMTEANEFWKIYKLNVIAIPTNKPLIRTNHADMIYLYQKEKWEAIVDEIERIHKWDVVVKGDGTELIGAIRKESDEMLEIQLHDTNQRVTVTPGETASIERRGRPILVGTTDVDKSEKLSAMLKRRGIKHELLNAKPEFAAREAEIVAQAGRIGAVTISTNMAGRGTDIILGGNPETMAWARLKDKYATRLDVPEDEWKDLVTQIESKEKMKEEGRRVAEMGGLHILGTERHEARRIDNQLRGRAGRQGDPGSSRFYLSLEDDLMRIFAGDWVRAFLEKLGMQRDQAIESRMVSRRIEAAQKKVEERNFDIRKNLLEYDEVMDLQRKRVYGFRQEILEGSNCKLRTLEMIDEQIDQKLEGFLNDDYGAATFAEFAGKRLGVELTASDFTRSDFTEADRTAREKASRMVPTQIHEAMEENLSTDVEASEWNWQAMAHAVNTRWGLKTTDRELKKLGRDGLGEHLIAQAEEQLSKVDLSAGRDYLEPNWGLRSICDWARLKFQIKLELNELTDRSQAQIKELVHSKVADLYRQKDIEFPVKLGMTRFMAEGPVGPGAAHRYDREGLFRWCQQRFPTLGEMLSEEDFRTQSRARLHEKLLEVSRKAHPAVGQEQIDPRLVEAFSGASVSEDEDAHELCSWAASELGLQIDQDSLSEVEKDEAQQVLWNAFDEKYRPEMRRMERSLLLSQLDTSWKNHLYTMDHLRSVVGLHGYAQEDPKTVYKKEGMQEFDAMWKNLQDKVSDSVFRMEQEEGFQESVWSIGAATHEQAQSVLAQAGSIQDQQQQAIANSQRGEKKIEPIRNRTEKVGRNEPCPCGSGKKYKNCCMRKAVS